MLTPRLKVSLESVKKLIRRNAKVALGKTLSKLHPADIAIIYNNLDDIDGKKLLSQISDEKLMSEIITEMNESDQIAVLKNQKPEKIARIVEHMESDDAAELVRLLPDEISDSVLGIISNQGGEISEVEQLLNYEEYTAGSIMNTSYFSLNEDTTVKEATKSLHGAENVDMVFYLYVTDNDNRLVGVISLRQLILNPPEKKLYEIMTSEVISVSTHEEQETVARIVEKYDLLAIPVVDDFNTLIGIITVDDVIDIIREEATEDIYMMVGSSDDELMFANKAMKIAKVRLPWLIITFIGSIVASIVLTYFQGKDSHFDILVPFVPIIMAMAGNAGSQSATILIRGVALGKVSAIDIVPVMLKEMRVGMIMGVTIGVLLGIIAPLWSGEPVIGLVVGSAMFFAMVIATFSGTFVPATLIRFNFDPAVASSPFISMLNDILGLTIYFSVSLVLLQYFL
jgi:magnesium transporter